MTISQGEFLEESTKVAKDTEDVKEIAGRSPWQITRSRLRRDKVSMVALVVVVFAVLLAIAAPILEKVGIFDAYSQHYNLVQGLGSLPTGHLSGISSHHWLGVVPQTGWDMASRVILGTTSSMAIALTGTLIAIVVGVVVGIISGFSGGLVDSGLGRLIDLVLSFPQTLMLLALSLVIEDRITALGVPKGNPTEYTYVIVVLGFFGWPTIARVIRGQVLSLREREFVEAARSLGARSPRIWFGELLPSLWAPILVYGSLLLPAYIGAEAALSYLGVGVQPPTPTLGNTLTDSVNYVSTDPFYFWVPGAVLIILVLSFNLLGDGLRDALDPKSDRH